MEAQIEEAIKFRKKANFKILTRLAQIIECSPHSSKYYPITKSVN